MKRYPVAALLTLCVSCATAHPPASPSSAPSSATAHRPPADYTPNLGRAVAQADSIVAANVGTLYPGAVFLVSRYGVLYEDRAFGYAQLNDYEGHRLASPPPMTRETMFDLASVTKVMGTTMAIMLLVDQERVDLDAPVYRYLPDFRDVHKDSITVRHLLQHSAGLVQWQPLYYHASSEREAYEVIRDMPLQWGVGEGRHYSDLSFMLLGYIAERVSGQRLDVFLDSAIYKPLGLDSITFVPKQHGFTKFAATEQGNVYERHMVYDSTFGYRYRGDPTAWDGWRHHVLNGDVDDGNSFYAHGGIAGHAGLFATVGQLRVLMDMLGTGGTARGARRVLSADVIHRFLTRDRYDNYLGWMRSPSLPEGSFHHTGFTGTYVLGVPKYGLSVILLTNRQNMGTDARGYFPNLAPLQEAIAKALIAGAEADVH
jgi:serine-type D-Ala-D-Ala carboxypeptidase